MDGDRQMVPPIVDRGHNRRPGKAFRCAKSLPGADMKILRPKNVSEAFSQTVAFIDDWIPGDIVPYCWFRGVNDNTLKLLPGAYWRTGYDEKQVLVSFAQEGVAYTRMLGANTWETYYLAQHHAVPTRLLDWSESFSAALFFAFDNWDGKSTPCIWIMRPDCLNKMFLGWEGILAPENVAQLQHWLPSPIAAARARVELDEEGYRYNNKWPLAVYPRKDNPRLVAQQGFFTVHGRKNAALDALYAERGGKVSDIFARVDLADVDKNDALRHLKTLGVRRSAIYPDIDNLVKELRQDFGW
jgi:hypothetical protein